jgi:predicted O-methyltransferase YrrM
LRQDYQNKELLILNDTPGQILECPSPGVKVINVPDRFPDLGAKIAYLIERARGDVFCRWDDDDISLPWRLRLSLWRLGARPYWRPTNYWFDDGRLCIPGTAGYCHSAGMFRRDVLRLIGGYPTNYAMEDAEDALFNVRAAKHGLDFAEDLSPDEHFYIYRWNTGSNHVSGSGCIGQAWRSRGAEQIQHGTFVIHPRWKRNYIDDVRRAASRAASTHLPASWETVPGHFDFERLYLSVLCQLPTDATVVEVGCWLGRSVIFLAQAAQQAGKRVRIYAVDNARGIAGQRLCLDDLHKNLESCGVAADVKLLVMDSADAADLFPDGSVDFVFIDAAHDYHNVRTDLQTWWPKVRPGGLLAGHDYTENHPEVLQAVDCFLHAAPYGCRSVLSSSCWQVWR